MDRAGTALKVILATARAIATTVYPDEDRQVDRPSWALHVKKQAILRLLKVACSHPRR
jgi:hypothetical protein